MGCPPFGVTIIRLSYSIVPLFKYPVANVYKVGIKNPDAMFSTLHQDF
jgi:hypothetical protein